MPEQLGVEDRAPELVPLNAIFSTDFVQILVPVTTAHTMDEVAAAVAYHSEGRHGCGRSGTPRSWSTTAARCRDT